MPDNISKRADDIAVISQNLQERDILSIVSDIRSSLQKLNECVRDKTFIIPTTGKEEKHKIDKDKVDKVVSDVEALVDGLSKDFPELERHHDAFISVDSKFSERQNYKYWLNEARQKYQKLVHNESVGFYKDLNEIANELSSRKGFVKATIIFKNENLKDSLDRETYKYYDYFLHPYLYPEGQTIPGKNKKGGRVTVLDSGYGDLTQPSPDKNSAGGNPKPRFASAPKTLEESVPNRAFVQQSSSPSSGDNKASGNQRVPSAYVMDEPSDYVRGKSSGREEEDLEETRKRTQTSGGRMTELPQDVTIVRDPEGRGRNRKRDDDPITVVRPGKEEDDFTVVRNANKEHNNDWLKRLLNYFLEQFKEAFRFYINAFRTNFDQYGISDGISENYGNSNGYDPRFDVNRRAEAAWRDNYVYHRPDDEHRKFDQPTEAQEHRHHEGSHHNHHHDHDNPYDFSRQPDYGNSRDNNSTPNDSNAGQGYDNYGGNGNNGSYGGYDNGGYGGYGNNGGYDNGGYGGYGNNGY